MIFASSKEALLGVILGAIFVLQFAASAAVPPEFQGNRDEPDYWLKRKDWFYRRTRFNLTEDNLRVIGAKRLLYQNKSVQPVGHLPYWFDYELFKRVYKKAPGASEQEELERHHVYISTCVRVLKARTLFRMLAGTSDTLITESADKFHWEQFGPIEQQKSGASDEDISLQANFKIEPEHRDESPLDRAIRLVSQEMGRVESKNQVEWYLRAFNEVDGSAIAGKLPY